MEEKAQCTLCSAVESPGFYTGCMIQDGIYSKDWECDGKGNLTRKPNGSEGPGPSPLAANLIASPSEAAEHASAPERAPDQLCYVAHKCRGEATLEIALRWDFGTASDPAPWYILQSTGHRVYPYWWEPCVKPFPIPPEGHRDFYEPRLESRPQRVITPRTPKTIDDLI